MNKWGIFAVVIIILYIVAGLGSKLFNVQDYEDKILVIPINGVITLEKSSGIYGLGGQSTETVLEDIKTAGKDKNKGNSPYSRRRIFFKTAEKAVGYRKRNIQHFAA